MLSPHSKTPGPLQPPDRPSDKTGPRHYRACLRVQQEGTFRQTVPPSIKYNTGSIQEAAGRHPGRQGKLGIKTYAPLLHLLAESQTPILSTSCPWPPGRQPSALWMLPGTCGLLLGACWAFTAQGWRYSAQQQDMSPRQARMHVFSTNRATHPPVQLASEGMPSCVAGGRVFF